MFTICILLFKPFSPIVFIVFLQFFFVWDPYFKYYD